MAAAASFWWRSSSSPKAISAMAASGSAMASATSDQAARWRSRLSICSRPIVLASSAHSRSSPDNDASTPAAATGMP